MNIEDRGPYLQWIVSGQAVQAFLVLESLDTTPYLQCNQQSSERVDTRHAHYEPRIVVHLRHDLHGLAGID